MKMEMDSGSEDKGVTYFENNHARLDLLKTSDCAFFSCFSTRENKGKQSKNVG